MRGEHKNKSVNYRVLRTTTDSGYLVSTMLLMDEYYETMIFKMKGGKVDWIEVKSWWADDRGTAIEQHFIAVNEALMME